MGTGGRACGCKVMAHLLAWKRPQLRSQRQHMTRKQYTPNGNASLTYPTEPALTSFEWYLPGPQSRVGLLWKGDVTC
jgi:hypothetical protein